MLLAPSVSVALIRRALTPQPELHDADIVEPQDGYVPAQSLADDGVGRWTQPVTFGECCEAFKNAPTSACPSLS